MLIREQVLRVLRKHLAGSLAAAKIESIAEEIAGLGDGGKELPLQKHIVFVPDRAGTINLWKADLEGENLKQLTKGDPANNPAVSPDAQWVLYPGGANPSLFKMSIDGGETVPIREKRSSDPEVSPDGRLIAVRSWYGEKRK